MTEGCGGDNDSDGLADNWEIQYFGNIAAYNAADDPDADGINNLQEFRAGTNPTTTTALPEPNFTSGPLYAPEPREVFESFNGDYLT
jgi:hypothetical protein